MVSKFTARRPPSLDGETASRPPCVKPSRRDRNPFQSNGLVRKSSAPLSRHRALFSASSNPVRISMGLSTPSRRIRHNTSCPSISGNIRSRMITSCPPRFAVAKPYSPKATVSTSYSAGTSIVRMLSETNLLSSMRSARMMSSLSRRFFARPTDTIFVRKG